MEKYLKTLSSLPLFSGIEKDHILTVLNQVGATIREYHKDEYIRLAQDPADFIGIVLEGRILISKDDYYGNRSITMAFEKGSIFAEAFACSGISELPVDILSCSQTTIMFLDRDLILHPCDRCCEFHHILIGNLLKIVAEKNLMLNKRLQYSAHKTTREKLMAYLDDQAKLHNSPEFVIPFDRQGLADFLGVERSAMSSEISRMVRQGYIETKRSYFKLLRPIL